jgi:hypothetical protein
VAVETLNCLLPSVLEYPRSGVQPRLPAQRLPIPVPRCCSALPCLSSAAEPCPLFVAAVCPPLQHAAPVKSCHWAKEAQYLVTGGWDRTVNVWDCRSPAAAVRSRAALACGPPTACNAFSSHAAPACRRSHWLSRFPAALFGRSSAAGKGGCHRAHLGDGRKVSLDAGVDRRPQAAHL